MTCPGGDGVTLLSSHADSLRPTGGDSHAGTLA
jgi:hypothetical protein